MAGSRTDEAPASTFFVEGAELAGYRVLGARSRGAMGVVYEGLELASGRRVAIKVLRSRALRFAHTVTREREVLALLRHPNIVAYVGHGDTTAGVPYLVTEWLEGEDLEARLARGGLAVDEAVGIAIAVARALGAAHAHGVVHRDVKPANIHLGGDASVKLLDFGVAQLGRQPAGLSVGTALYMAPEQIRATASVDARADVYALGSVLFECLAGRPPFEGERTTMILARAIFEPPPRLASVGARVSAALEALVLRMLAKRPEERPSSGDEAAALLEACRAGAATPEIGDGERALESEEQRIGCVALVSAPAAAGDAATMIDADAPVLVGRLGALADEFGVELDGLGDGAFLVTAPDVSAADQAARIGRFALGVVGALPEASAALATGTLGGSTSSAIERAEELLRRTTPGCARVCAATASLLGGRIPLREDALVTAPAPSLLLRQAETCVGRDALVGELLEVARAAGAVLVLGDAGIGKTCIMHETGARLQREGRSIIGFRGELHRARSPLAPLADWMRRRFVDVAALRAEGRRLLGDAGLEAHASALLRVAGLAEDAARAGDVPVEPSVAALLVADAKDCNALVVLDDAQWLDPASARVVERVASSGVGVLVFTRPEGAALLPAITRRVVVGALDADSARALALAEAPDLGAEPEAVDRLLERAHGHPFVVRELARAASEGIAGLPDTVLGIVQARLAELPDDARHVARLASLLGERFSPGALRRLARDAPAMALESLVGARVLARGEDGSLSFVTTLLRDAAYELFTADDRAAAHAEVAAWFDGEADRDPALVAWHAERGRDPVRAARAYADAARRAFAVSAVTLAIEHARRGIACGPERATLGVLRLVESEALAVAGEFGEARSRAAEAAEQLELGSAQWFTAMHVQVKALGRRADVAALVGLFEPVARVTARGREAEGNQLRAIISIASWLYTLGRAGDAEPMYRDVLARAPGLELVDAEQALLLHFQATRAEHRGEWGVVLDAHVQVEALYLRAGDRPSALVSGLILGGANGERGDLERAITILGDVVREAGARGIGYVHGYARFLRGRSLRRAGRHEEAEEELTRALTDADEDRRLRGQAHTELARIALDRGDLDEARERAELAIELTTAIPAANAPALAVLAEVLLVTEGPDRARAPAEKALAVLAVESSDDPAYVWRVRVAVALAAEPNAAATRELLRASHADLLQRSARATDSDEHRRAYLALPDNAALARYWTLSGER